MTSDTHILDQDEPAAHSPDISIDGGPVPHADEVSVLDILVVLAERKRIVFFITAICAVLSIVVSFLLPVRYTATVTVLPPQQNSSIGAALSSQLGSLGSVAALAGGNLGLRNPNELYVGMLRSRSVEDAIVAQYGLMKEYRKRYESDARKAFENRSVVDGSGKDGLIHISVEDSDPIRAAKIANSFVDQFRNLSQSIAITEASQRRVFFEHELVKAKDNLADSEEALKRTEQKTGVIQLDSQARALIESAATLRAQISAREVQIQGMQTYATGENSQLIQAQRELEGLRAQLAKLGGSGDIGDGELLVPKGLVPEAGLEYGRKLRDVKYYETIFEILARQFEIAKLDEAKEGALIQVVDPAIPPDRRSSPKRALIIICATLAGFVLAIATVMFQNFWARMEADPEVSQKISRLGWNLGSRARQKHAESRAANG